MINSNSKVYGIFYKSHGLWTPFNNRQTLSLPVARTVKQRVRKAYKSNVIIRRIKFV